MYCLLSGAQDQPGIAANGKVDHVLRTTTTPGCQRSVQTRSETH